MRLTLVYILASLAFSASAAAKMADMVDCWEYIDPFRDDGIHWNERQDPLPHDISDQTDNTFDRQVEGYVTLNFKRRNFLPSGHVHYVYHQTATLESNGGFNIFTSELVTSKGAVAKWKFNIKDKKGKILHAYWLNTNAQCRVRSDFNLADIGEITVQHLEP
jgi:hypothetical protein